MPDRIVRGVRINYEVIGNSGPWIALTPGSRRAYGELTGLAKQIAASDYRVLLHDRRNCGASEVSFDGSASENEIWADDLYELGSQLGALPMYVGGSSSGARLAILYALRHPAALRLRSTFYSGPAIAARRRVCRRLLPPACETW